MNASALRMLKQTVQDFEARALAKRERLAELSVTDPDNLLWVVVSADGLSLAFDIENGVASNPRVTTALKAPTFDREFAHRLGVNTFNGRNERGTCASLRAQLVKEAEGLEQSAAQLRALQPAE